MIRELSKTSFDRIEKSYLKIFSGNNPFVSCFKKEIVKVRLIYPVDGYKLNEDQYSALIQTVSNSSDSKEVLVSEIEAESVGDIFISNRDITKYELKHWIFDLSTTYDEYKEMDINVENAIYSTQGDWGIMISHEEHAVMGGSAEFLNVFGTKYSEFDNSIDNFKKFWEYNRKNYNSKLEWYDDFLKSLRS